MAKAGRGADQYMLRFPDGLRDRIKAVAERNGTSINSEIVRVLEREFPEQWPLDRRFQQMAEMMHVLKFGSEDPRVEQFVEEFEETIIGMVSGRVTGVTEETRDGLIELWRTYKTRESEDELHAAEAETYYLTEEEADNLDLIGRTEKYAVPPPRRKKLGEMTNEELAEYMARQKNRLTDPNETPAPELKDGEDPFKSALK